MSIFRVIKDKTRGAEYLALISRSPKQIGIHSSNDIRIDELKESKLQVIIMHWICKANDAKMAKVVKQGEDAKALFIRSVLVSDTNRRCHCQR